MNVKKLSFQRQSPNLEVISSSGYLQIHISFLKFLYSPRILNKNKTLYNFIFNSSENIKAAITIETDEP